MRKDQYLILLISTIYICIISIWGNPIYNSSDDVWVLYRYSGSDGYAPTYLAHYNYGWHYFFGYLVSVFFEINPNYNWYSLILLVLNGISIAPIGFVLQIRLREKYFWLCFVIYLIFIASNLIIKLNVSATSLHLALSGITIFWIKNKIRNSNIIFVISFFLLITSAFLRLHICFFVIFIFAPFVLLFHPKEFLKSLAIHFLLLGLLIYGLSYLHASHYEKKIKNWSNNENFRQSVFSIVNKPYRIEADSVFVNPTVIDYINAGIVFDTNFVSTNKIKEFAYSIQVNYVDLFNKREMSSNYWLIKNNLFLFPPILILSILFYYSSRVYFKKFLLATFHLLFTFIILKIFYKITPEIVLGFFSVIYIMLLMHTKNGFFVISHSKKIFHLLIIFSFVWGIRIILMTSHKNHRESNVFKSQMREIISSPDNLFILTSQELDIGKCSIWQIPKDLPMNNILDFYRQLGFSTSDIFQRFKLNKDFNKNNFNTKKVFVIGSNYGLLKHMYPSLNFSSPLADYTTMEVRRIIN